MGIDWHKYTDLDAWKSHNQYFKNTVIGVKVYWEIKRDGSNTSLLFHKGFPIFYTRNQKAVESVELECKKLLKDRLDELYDGLREKLQIYFEHIRKGKSPARYEVNDEAEWVAFDVWDIRNETYLSPPEKYSLFDSMGIPYIEPYKTEKYNTIEDFEADIDHMIEFAKEKGYEGFVAKWTCNEKQYAVKVKVEHKYPKEKPKKKEVKHDSRPTLETSEILGAIDKVRRDIGEEKFRDKRIAMPLIAKAVSIEEKKHGKKCRANIFAEYLTTL